MRALLDANLLISYLLTPDADSSVVRIVRAAVEGRFDLILPEELLAELAHATRDKKYLARRITPRDVGTLGEILSSVAQTVLKIAGPIPAVTRDRKDDYLLAYAVVGEADYLVTRDRDLLSLAQVDKLQIVTPRAFCQILGL